MSHDYATNAALGFFHKQLGTHRVWGPIGFHGQWLPSWKEDVLAGIDIHDEGKNRASLALYADGTESARGLYLEVTKDSASAIRARLSAQGYTDISIHEDQHQRYVIARRVGR